MGMHAWCFLTSNRILPLPHTTAWHIHLPAFPNHLVPYMSGVFCLSPAVWGTWLGSESRNGQLDRCNYQQQVYVNKHAKIRCSANYGRISTMQVRSLWSMYV